ncbi:MAG: PAS domain S-box protein [Deltaproteobacteria bacterium]|nr:PAS domain S-box protein [Deltaproteobacteria bacterium]
MDTNPASGGTVTPAIRRTIRVRLMTIIMLGSVTVVAFTCVAFIVFSILDYRREAAEDLSSLARIVAHNSTVALSFGIPEDVEGLLLSLETRPSVVLGCVYDREGNLFAQYRRQRNPLPGDPPPVRESGSFFENGRLLLFAPIRHQGKVLGTIHIQDDLSAGWLVFVRNLLGASFIMLVAMLLAWLAASRLQRGVSGPILALTKTARTVLEKGDYSQRAATTSDDEIGVLASTFNRMLLAIESRDAEVRGANEALQAEVMQRRQAQEALFHEKELLSVTLRSIGDGVVSTDAQGRVTFINRVAETLTGWTEREAAGRPLDAVMHLVHEETGALVENPATRVLDTGTVSGLANHTILVARDGTRRAIADSGAPIRAEDGEISGAVLVFRDVTEERKVEAEMTRIQKLQTVQVLAAGIAHDFNNLLSAILGFVSLARHSLPAGGEASDGRLQKAEAAVARARDLTLQLLTFTSGGEPVRGTATLDSILREAAAFALRGADTRCDFDIEDNLWPTNVDAGQIGQVVQNLVLNADQASNEGGTILVAARNRLLTSTSPLPLPTGKYVEVSVTDHGIGIPAENLPRIFDPFFTTKSKGSGLGLAVCFSIIKKHEGHIEVESAVGRGSVFRFWLHASHGERNVEMPVLGKLPLGSGRVLVMDDEEAIREVARDMLNILGYDPDVSCDGAQTIELYRRALQEDRPYHVVILDLTIPGGMGGKDTLRELQKINPDVRAIVSTGYSSDPVLSNPLEYGFAAFVRKPYDIGALAMVMAGVVRSGG